MSTQTNTTSKPALAVSRGRVARPQKAVIYGPEGVGKSTLAGGLPDPVFLDTEGGTHHLDVARLEAGPAWEETVAALARLARADHPFKTLVIDTADWLEKRLGEHLCRKAGKESIEDFGYGKGWVLLGEEFARFLGSLDALLARGMHVVFLAHSTVRKFEAPDQAGSYDRFELKLCKQAAPVLKEWADALLFATYVTRTVEKDNGKLRGVGGKERVLFCNHAAAYDAKNRHGLPDRLPFSAEALAPVFGAATSVRQEATKEPTMQERLRAVFGGREAEVVPFLVDRGQIKDGEGLEAVPAGYAARMLADADRFLKAVAGFNQAREVAAAR